MVELVPIVDVAEDAVERLLDHAFGPGRHLRTAYRIREGMRAIDSLGFAAFDADLLVGSIQCWPIALAGDDGTASDLVMLGPVAVEPERQRDGIGRMLTAASLAMADRMVPAVPVMLIGDPEYYGRFFGFSADHTALWRVPGPVEMRRLLARGADVPDRAGLLGPRVAVPA